VLGTCREQPGAGENPLVAQRIILAAEAPQPLVGERIAVERVLRVIDRPGVVPRILEEAADQRLAAVSCQVSFPAPRLRLLFDSTSLPARGPAGRVVWSVLSTRS